MRQSKGIGGIQNRKFRHDVFVGEYFTDLQFSFRISNNGTGIHFGACAHHSQHGAYGQCFAGRLFESDVIFFPRIFVAIYGNRNSLCVVYHRAAAYSQQQVGIGVTRYFNALVQFIYGWIRHYACDFCNGFAVLI